MLRKTICLLLVLTVVSFHPGIDTADVRLTGSKAPCAGIVQVRFVHWERVCDSQWDMKDAAVVCRELNCGVPNSVPPASAFGAQKNDRVGMSDVQCKGDEKLLLQCPHNTQFQQFQSFCYDGRYAAVNCTGPDEVRLVNGTSVCSGRVEVKHIGVWGTVCDDSWDLKDASVVCRQIGCISVKEYEHNPRFGRSSLPVGMSNVQCRGDEATLLNCPHKGLGHNTCTTERDAGVTCTGVVDKIRLVNAGDECNGRVEVRHGKRWGTVCDSHWDMKDAQVVCRHFGCGSALRAPDNNGVFGAGWNPVWLSRIRCTGAEASWFDCPHDAWGHNACHIRSDAGVECSEKRKLQPQMYKESIFLDPNTAHPALNISADGKRVTRLPNKQNVAKNAERFWQPSCVLGTVGFTSGKHYWELMVPKRSRKPLSIILWYVGVARQSVTSNAYLQIVRPESGFWVLARAAHLPYIHSMPERLSGLLPLVSPIGVYLDFKGGLVSFFNAETQEHLFTYTDTFTEKVFPVVCSYMSSAIELS
ncbi:CD5 antigen-like [Lissotriton helveticus]